MELNKREKTYLRKLYTAKEKVGALRGPKALYDLVKSEDLYPHITLNQIRKWLSSQTVYTTWKPRVLKFKRNRIYAMYPKHIFEFDLMYPDGPQVGRDGVTYRYVLLGIDVFSKYAFYTPLPNNKAKALLGGLKKIFEDNKYYPELAYGDPAGEHKSKRVKKYFSEKNIHLYFSNSEIHCPHVERFIRTLKSRLRRYNKAHNNRQWIRPIKAIVNSYNNSITRVHGMTPRRVLYGKDNRDIGVAYARMYLGKRKQLPRTSKVKYKIDDYVRLSRLKGAFEKESSEWGGWSPEVYKISEVWTDQQYPMYGVTDLNGEKLKGKFYTEELQKILFDSKKLFPVSIEETKTINGTKMAYVKYKGYGNKHNMWIPLSIVVDVPVGRPVELA